MNPTGRNLDRRMPRPPLPDTSGRRWAWFLDVDGTLLEIEARPERVSADAGLIRLLENLGELSGGAVALVSGRSLEQLDRIFGRYKLPAAASHGIEQRLPDGEVKNGAAELPAGSVARVESFAARHPGLQVERKTFSVALHYRDRPDLEHLVLETMENISRQLDSDAKLMRGKMMVEILPSAAGKGSAIRSFMETAPFAGRLPVFAGDDVTDEHGFEVVNELGGISVHVGHTADSAAKWRLSNVADVRNWLQAAIGTGANTS
jgi:trehalose 6-phosphate phosphatase